MLLQRILAPTDGSPASERALPFAEQIARAHGAELVLLYIVAPHPLGRGGPAGTIGAREAGAYLAGLKQRLQASGLAVRQRVEHGPPAATLLAYERDEPPDLLVLASHGRTGLARIALGSVADRMVREGTAPVLVVRGLSTAPPRLATALVMLDGSRIGEEVLDLVEKLAGHPLQAITLFRAVAEPQGRAAAETYLQGAMARLANTGVPITTLVRVGEPRQVVEQAAKPYDLVVLSTHGRGGFDRWRHGSVAARLIHELPMPVLVTRAGPAGPVEIARATRVPSARGEWWGPTP